MCFSHNLQDCEVREMWHAGPTLGVHLTKSHKCGSCSPTNGLRIECDYGMRTPHVAGWEEFEKPGKLLVWFPWDLRDWTSDCAVRKSRDAGPAVSVFLMCSQLYLAARSIDQPKPMRRIPFALIMIFPSNEATSMYKMTTCQHDDLATVGISFQATDLTPDLTCCKTSCLRAFSTMPRTQCSTSWPYECSTSWTCAVVTHWAWAWAFLCFYYLRVFRFCFFSASEFGCWVKVVLICCSGARISLNRVVCWCSDMLNWLKGLLKGSIWLAGCQTDSMTASVGEVRLGPLSY